MSTRTILVIAGITLVALAVARRIPPVRALIFGRTGAGVSASGETVDLATGQVIDLETGLSVA